MSGDTETLRALLRMCGECMNASEFVARVIVPQEGRCEVCGRADNGKVWELWGVSKHPDIQKAGAP